MLTRDGVDGADTLSGARVADLLRPFGLELTADQTGQLLTYLDLLHKWNRKINLTGIQTAEIWVTRHFGESLYLWRQVRLQGRNLDIGSGAGFPGLALKIIFPGVAMTLLEPVSKKRAFLKEVARTCHMSDIEVRPERLQDYSRRAGGEGFDSVTSRAVGNWVALVEQAPQCLTENGLLCFWTTLTQAEEIGDGAIDVAWDAPLPLPGSRERVIMVGRKLTQ
jgi:16S rRNA (guanine(527)-N(7))-methyltransferase RsmG